MKNQKVKWIIEKHLLDRALPTGRPNLAEALMRQGIETLVIDRKPGFFDVENLPKWENECVVAYGTVQFVTLVNRARRGAWQPGSFYRPDNLSYASFSPHLGDIMLNDDYVVLPFGEFVRRGLKPWGSSVFVRPNSVAKLFTGHVIPEKDFELEINSLKQLSNVMPDDLIVISSAKNIIAESRFIIAEGKVVAGSTYNWDNILDVRSDYPPSCYELATEVARRDWQADTVYTCDIALTLINGSPVPRVVELNAFSCSGLYACDTNEIAEAVSTAAWNEWSGDDLG